LSTDTNLPRLLTLPAAKAELRKAGADVSTDTLRREADRGHLRLTRIGRKVFIRADHLQDYLVV
jgi:excisionase family DNA binding protein